MSRYKRKTEVRCPYYLESGARTIRCEGPAPETWLALTFLGPKARRSYMKQTCYTEFCRCGLYKEQERRYEAMQ